MSQLLSCWTSSDVNSNMNAAPNNDKLQLQHQHQHHHHHHHHHHHNHHLFPNDEAAVSAEALAEANNNNNTLNNNEEEFPPPPPSQAEAEDLLMENNPVPNAAASPTTAFTDATGVSTPQDELIQIPEILINLLKIWDFVSSESMKVFTAFNATKRDGGGGDPSNRDVEEMFVGNEAAGPGPGHNAVDPSAEGAPAEACENCGSRMQLIQELIPFGINIDASNAFRNCDCVKDRLNKAAKQQQQQQQQEPGKDNNGVFQQQSNPMSKGERRRREREMENLRHLRIARAWQRQHDEAKYAAVANIQQLYDALSAGCLYLLSAVPANAPASLTGTFRLANSRSNSNFRNYVLSAGSGGDDPNSSSSSPQTRLTIDHFTVPESGLVFQSLHHLGIQKSVYEQRLAEEKLSDLAILSLQQEEENEGEAEDYQQLLSPESATGEGAADQQQKTSSLEAKKSTFKFYRSISVGMNDSHSNDDHQVGQPHHHPNHPHPHHHHHHPQHHPQQQYHHHHRRKSPYRQYMQQYNNSSSIAISSGASTANKSTGNQLIGKSSETLDSTLSDDHVQQSMSAKFNMPFLCKPSSRLISLIQQCMDNNGSGNTSVSPDHHLGTSANAKGAVLAAVRSPLFTRDVFRFIFSCYKIDMFSLVQRSTVCAAGFRSLGLHAANWLLVNVSTTAAVHDAFWIFVSSLLPREVPVIDWEAELGGERSGSTPAQGCENGADQKEGGEEAAVAAEGAAAAGESPAKKRQKKEPKGEKRRPSAGGANLQGEGAARSAAVQASSAAGSGASNRAPNFSDVCRHPFATLALAGESAEGWVTDGLQHYIRSVAKLLPLLPPGSALQQMAIRCLGVDFKPRDHIFLHECKVFSHISTILTRSSSSLPSTLPTADAVPEDKQQSSSRNSEEGENDHLENPFPFTLLEHTVDATSRFELTTSSRSSMIPSLLDGSTETFWESGNEDRTRVKYFSLAKSKDETVNNPRDNSHIKFLGVYFDNVRDSEYRVRLVEVKLMMEKADALKHCGGLSGGGDGGAGSGSGDDAYAANLSLFTGASEIEFAKVATIHLDSKFCGWMTVELSEAQSREIVSSFKYLRIELSGSYQSIRVRQLKLLSVANFADTLSSLLSGGRGRQQHQQHYAAEHQKIISVADSLKLVAANCESETLRVFRLLSSQVSLSSLNFFQKAENNTEFFAGIWQAAVCK